MLQGRTASLLIAGGGGGKRRLKQETLNYTISLGNSRVVSLSQTSPQHKRIAVEVTVLFKIKSKNVTPEIISS